MDRRINILTPECVAQLLKVSLSWVYKNQKLLGGRKLGGILRFPSEEVLYERIFSNEKWEEDVSIRIRDQRNSILEQTLTHKTRGEKSRSRKERGGEKQEFTEGDPNRYGLLDACK